MRIAENLHNHKAADQLLKNPYKTVTSKMNMTAAALRINTLDGENFELIESIKTKEKIATKANRETNDGGAVKNQRLLICILLSYG